MPSDTETTYCHVCLGDVPTCKVAKCPNGHACCEMHHIQRVKAIYESGRNAFDDESDGGGGQLCFECRAVMPDELFSRAYLNMLDITIAVEMAKKANIALTNGQLETILNIIGTKPTRAR